MILQRDLDRLFSKIAALDREERKEERLRPLLCEAGIHDYEFAERHERGALLECIYCGRQKLSMRKP